ncbi:hypothetical protein L3X38_043441 [Prunus dulcis]|uniref:Uncharacterized protein n=1 Tax=Prunus dulcis TaxID=3755 RepID=A0AAD4UWG8_PRUDU|nr:hypothetical protein L3X38_043441 [Prunus dulcis]
MTQMASSALKLIMEDSVLRALFVFLCCPCTPPRQFSIEDSLCAKEIVDQDGKSSLLSPVKAFDSVVLAIYEVLQILRFSVFRFALLLLS